MLFEMLVGCVSSKSVCYVCVMLSFWTYIGLTHRSFLRHQCQPCYHFAAVLLAIFTSIHCMGNGAKHYLPFSLSLPEDRNLFLTFSDFLQRFGILRFDHTYYT
ncbi:MAG: hypothetical protein NXY57DRAFT_1030879 [Lentinula lateritia]|nr:MAG: hypothetical protein NXY57DRAFT_1030879 [Lentinula lateritia]